MADSRNGLPAAMKAFALLMCIGVEVRAISEKIPAHKPGIVLFDGSNLNNFDIFRTILRQIRLEPERR